MPPAPLINGLLGLLMASTSTAVAQQQVASAPREDVTFTEHVAPIVFEHCASCHRPGEIGPFPLLTYRDVSKRGRQVHRVVKRREMPPWSPVAGHGQFMGERRLSDGQIALISQWVDAGMPEGDAADLPELPEFADGWQLGEPDLVVTMPKAFEVPASGPDIYRNFVIPLDLPEDRWVVGWELRPGARTVLHHTLVNFDTTGRARRTEAKSGGVGFRGMSSGSGNLGIWAVGATPRKLPEGLAIKLPKGADLVLSSHFHLSGKPEQERTTLGLYFSDQPPTRSLVPLQLPPMWGFAYRIDIPAGEKNYRVRDFAFVPADCEAVEVSSHAHSLCRSMAARAILPSGDVVKLFYIADWDFNWQGGYTYRAPVPLPAGTRVEVEFTYDNSADNPYNPHDPPQRVRVGRETTDEMARITLTLVPEDEADAADMKRKLSRLTRVRGLAVRKLMAFDANGDGFADANEVPKSKHDLLRHADANGDGKLSYEEADAAAPTRRRRG